ncbi:MAG: hypothetical protein HY754_11560 [Nitrospirae bacterium]|nr:hypothetical protein [Nitrospirota bacterium]
MKKNLLFVSAYNDEGCGEGLSYAIDLAKVMNEGIAILLIYKKNLMKRVEDVMAAIAFAEAGEHETAREIAGNKAACSDETINFFTKKCRDSGVEVSVQIAAMDMVPAVKDFLGGKKGIDMVLLSPSVTNNGNVTSRELQKLVKTASRPIVTMARQAYA